MHDLPKTEIGIYIFRHNKTNREARDACFKQLDKFGNQLLIMPCGVIVKYKSIEEIPDEDISCPCGDPNHWLVKYD